VRQAMKAKAGKRGAKRKVIMTSWDCRECDSHAHIDHRLNPGRIYSPTRHAVETGHSKFDLNLVTEEGRN